MVADANEADHTAATSSGANAERDNKHPNPELNASAGRNTESGLSSAPALAGKLKVVGEEVADIKKTLQQIVRRLDRLRVSMNDVGVVSSEETSSDLAHTVVEPQASSREQAPRGEGGSGGVGGGGRHAQSFRARQQRYVGRFGYYRKPNWTLKVFSSLPVSGLGVEIKHRRPNAHFSQSPLVHARYSTLTA